MRLGCFLLATLLLLPFPFWINSSRIFVQSSSFVTICTILAGGTIWVGSILGLAFAVISLARKRWFCRYICPVGLLLDAVSGVKFPGRFWWKRFPPIGKYIVLLTAAGAILGYPLFLWLDPLAFLNNAFSVYNATGVLSAIASSVWHRCASCIGINFGGFLVRPDMPSRCYAGPPGYISDLFAEISGRQTKQSPAQKLRLEMHLGQQGECSLPLPQAWDAAYWHKKSVRQDLTMPHYGRPAQLKRTSFRGLCLRCGNCIRACPSKIIHPDTGQSGVLGFLSPVVRYEMDYCKEECNACTRVCPSGALQSLNLEQKNRYVIGTASVDTALCLWGVSECHACLQSCPYEAIKVQFDEEAYESFPGVDPAKCNGCGACEAVCPTGDLKAIKVWKKNG